MSDNLNGNDFLTFESVCFSYPASDKQVLKNFDMPIEQGSVTAVLGPNGTGKTTMLLLALGWLKPTSGFIKVSQFNVSEISRKELGHTISLVPQFEQISFDFSILDYVLMGRVPYISALQMPQKKDYEIAIQALEKVGLKHKAQDSVQHISGGEKQLILLARALAQQTKMLLLDEPTSHLDIKNKAKLINILKDLAKEDKTIVLTTHEADVAAAVATNVILVKEGKVFKCGKTEEMMTDENLTKIYDIEVKVKKVDNRLVFLWG